VPYTSRNSANCVGADGDLADPAPAFAWLCQFVAERSPDGSDPGVCLARADRVGEAVVAFGRRVQRELVRRQEAEALATQDGCLLAGLAGTRDGVIGALAAVGLRAGGADGRFVGLGRLRDLGERVQVRELLEAGVDAVESLGPARPQDDEWVETLGWARPRLARGRAVLLVERSEKDGVDWIVADRRRNGAGHGSHGSAD
jgi:hypothetical protein